MTDHNDFLFQAGGKSFKFENLGDTVKGEVISAEVRQQTSMDGELLTWQDGSPRKQLVIGLQTDERDNDDDDGVRMIYAKGGKYDIGKGEGQSMRDAIAAAVKVEGESRLEVGDELAVSYTGSSVPKRGYSPAKLYIAAFRKAKAGVAATDLFGDARENQPDPF